MNEILKSIYYNPSNPAGFASIEKLYNAVKSKGITLRDVKDWLSGENTYTLHRDARRHFKRNKIYVTQPNEQFQADLVDMQEFSKLNKGFKYILTVIDCFSRYAFAIPVKNKTGIEIRNALKNISKPVCLQTDRGKEFLNKPVQDYLKENNIRFFTSHNNVKCSMVERFNRTLKSKMFKYFSAKGTRNYLEVLDKLIYAYNRSYHRSIKARPIDVTEDNAKEIFFNIYGCTPREYLISNVTPKLKVGDKVRRKYELTPMDKGYYPNWTDVIYTVDKSIKGRRPMYALKFDGTKIHQRFYPEEVQKIKDKVYRIEKIIQRKTVNGRKGYIVKWLGYSSDHNSWVPESDIIKLNA